MPESGGVTCPPQSQTGEERRMPYAKDARRFFTELLRPLGLTLIVSAFVIASAATLVGLLGIFVAWLVVVVVLIGATLIGDLVRHSARRLMSSPIDALNRAVGYTGR